MPRLLISSSREEAGLEKRTLPKIAGSQGAFIAVIVALVLTIMFSCIAIFFLLRNNETSDQDRAVRHRNKRRQRPAVSNSSFNYSPSVLAPQAASKSRWFSIFDRSRRDNKQAAHGKPGWMKAGSADWDGEHDSTKHSTRSPEVHIFPVPVRSPPASKFVLSSRPASITPYERSRVTVQYSPMSHHSPISTPLTAAHPSSPSTPPSFPVPIRSSSPEPMPDIEENDLTFQDERQDSGQSHATVWTFEGGTKFIESL